MGARNVAQVFANYGSLGDRAFRTLIYMALVSSDGDAEPWFGLGTEAIAEHALARKVPAAGDDPQGREAALRMVGRAVMELKKAGAIRVAAHARFGLYQSSATRYRLFLDKPCPDGYEPKPHGNTTPPKRSDSFHPNVSDAERRETAVTFGQNPPASRTRDDGPSESERPTKEEEHDEEKGNKTSVVNRTVEGAPTDARSEDHFQGSLLVGISGGAPPDTPWPGRSNRWRDPRAKALEQAEASRLRREAAERSAAS